MYTATIQIALLRPETLISRFALKKRTEMFTEQKFCQNKTQRTSNLYLEPEVSQIKWL